LDGTLSFDEKIHQSAALFRFGLWDVGIFQIFFSLAILQSTIGDSSTFLEPGLTENIVVCAHPTCLPKK
jgi:hypothetical protein